MNIWVTSSMFRAEVCLCCQSFLVSPMTLVLLTTCLVWDTPQCLGEATTFGATDLKGACIVQ